MWEGAAYVVLLRTGHGWESLMGIMRSKRALTLELLFGVGHSGMNYKRTTELPCSRTCRYITRYTERNEH